MPSPLAVLHAPAVWSSFLVLLLQPKHVQTQDSKPTGPTMPNIAENCNAFHTVQEGGEESCWSIAQEYSITLDQFYEWNPDVSDDCAENFWVGYSYCVGVGEMPNEPTTTITTTAITSTAEEVTTTTGDDGSTNTSSVITTTEPYSTRYPITDWNITATSTETAFPPQKTQPGQPAECNDWYLVSATDTCEGIVASSSWLTLEQLHKWNPALLDDCSGLYEGWWICVSVRVQNVTVSFGWTTTDAPADVPTLTEEYTPTTFPPINSSFTASPTQSGIVSGCQVFYQAREGDTCRVVLDEGIISEEDFFEWNPALDGNCDGLWANYWYCIVGPDGIRAMPPTVTARPTSVPSGQIDTCEHWYQRDGESCEDLVAMFGTFSLDDFLRWNPSVGSNCDNLVDGAWYCVGIPGTPTTRTAPLPTTQPTSLPTQSGVAPDCTDFWLVGPDDTCASIIASSGITESEFFVWNPAVGSTTCDNLIEDFYVCVGVGGGLESDGPTGSPTVTPATVPATITATTTTTSSGRARRYSNSGGHGRRL
ncbi:hypothetical protein VTO42DRAFT_5486 [Malbranchea cinnamomea]